MAGKTCDRRADRISVGIRPWDGKSIAMAVTSEL